MPLPSPRIWLATTLLLVAIFGSGMGLAMRWRNEWMRTEPHRFLAAALKRLEHESLVTRENSLRMWADRLANYSGYAFTPQKRYDWLQRIQIEHQKVELEIDEANQKHWQYRRSCN